MPEKIRWLAITWLLAGCAAVGWENLPVDKSWRENGWDNSYYCKINNYEMFIFVGQIDDQPGLMLFCSGDPYRQSWEKIIIRYANGRIAQFAFAAKVNGEWIADYAKANKVWQNADFNCLRNEKNLQDLPIELKNKIRQVLNYGDSKYTPPPPGRTHPAQSRLTKLG
ncbi:MAG: hypothetical protein NTZ18_00515 [Candidatus Komeilibacteria bacterium]|nr:hypothetical protein [Candidatus Komeilibacteria bacterium]